MAEILNDFPGKKPEEDKGENNFIKKRELVNDSYEEILAEIRTLRGDVPKIFNIENAYEVGPVINQALELAKEYPNSDYAKEREKLLKFKERCKKIDEQDFNNYLNEEETLGPKPKKETNPDDLSDKRVKKYVEETRDIPLEINNEERVEKKIEKKAEQIRKEEIEEAEKFMGIKKDKIETKTENPWEDKLSKEELIELLDGKEAVNKKKESKEGKEIVLEKFLKEKEASQKEKIESSEKIKNALLKTQEWWKGVDKKAAGKAAGKALLLSGVTIGLGALLGINTSNLTTTAIKISSRGLSAAGVNMAITSNLAHKFLSKKEENTTENKNWLKKNFGWGDAASVLGIGASAILSGGLAVPAISLGGYAFRKLLNGTFDKKIKKLQNENTEENKTKIEKLKFIKSILGGSSIIAAGLGTMAMYSHQTDLEHETILNREKLRHETDLKNLNNLKHQTYLKHELELKQQADLKAKIEEGIRLKDAIVGKGEGVEHSFIRQIEHNPELAKELGFKGDIKDLKSLSEFAGQKAHTIAIKEGYIDNAGHEVRVTEADKIAYELKIKDGHIIVEEKDANGKILETHHEGEKFEEKGDKYEKIYSKEKNVSEIYRSNIEKLFPEDTVGIWSDVRELKASEIIGLTNPGRLAGLTNYLKQLENATGLAPKTGFMKLYPESVFNYVNRALAEATKKGLLDKVKL